MELRRATADDLPDLALLLAQRDEDGRREAHVSATLCDLDPERIAVWIASAHGEPAGMTALYLRSMRWPGRGEVRVGYWAHLFVVPEHRRLMLYPQLVFAMRKAMRELGIAAIVTGNRRPSVAEGHLKLGFAVACTWPVRIKPLRPFRLLGKHKGVAWARALAPLGDSLWRLRIRRPKPPTGIELEHVQDAAHAGTFVLDAVADLLAERSGDRISTAWTADLLRARLAVGIDGEPYRLVLARRGGAIEGVAIYRTASRGDGVHTGALLELAARDDDARTLAALRGAVEVSLLERDADVALWLDGAGGAASEALRGGGYIQAKGEQYQMLVFPADDAERAPANDPGNWRFTLLDHDAF
ncbi:MAG: GNAT family N-acetyltransferase [Planctomycetota bacterium]